MSGVGIRRNWSSLSATEKSRFAAAIQRMQQGGQPANSSYWRLASEHGWPSRQPDGSPNICAHRIQTFPTWHRPFLRDFELALQAADRANGGLGDIWLPYWNWTAEQTLPAEFRNDPRLNRLPSGFFATVQPPDFPPALRNPVFQRALDSDVRATLQRQNVAGWVLAALSLSDWGQFSTTTYGNNFSLENPHDWVHVAVAGIMGNPATSAFDPIFWLHHCNIDRLFETFLRRRPSSETQSQTLGVQEQQRGGVNRYTTPLFPFVHSNGTPWMPTEAFKNCRTLSYDYDLIQSVPARAAMMAAKPPKHSAVFSNINVPALGPNSWQLHVFLVNSKFPAPPVTPVSLETLFAYPNYAGGAVLFTGNPGCVACKESEPITRTVHLDPALAKMGVAPGSVSLFVIAIDSTGSWHDLSSTPIPAPTIQSSGDEKEEEEEKAKPGKAKAAAVLESAEEEVAEESKPAPKKGGRKAAGAARGGRKPASKRTRRR